MPRGDGTGPEGKGPMTGRGAGDCGDNNRSEDRRFLANRRGSGRGSNKNGRGSRSGSRR